VVLQGFLQRDEPQKLEIGIDRLTSREREIVQLLGEGKSNKDIARLLDLSVKTVETHRSAVLRKLDLSSLVDLVRWAIRNNLVQP
jgi:DNA-binding NarL/FixJ family response regulator